MGILRAHTDRGAAAEHIVATLLDSRLIVLKITLCHSLAALGEEIAVGLTAWIGFALKFCLSAAIFKKKTSRAKPRSSLVQCEITYVFVWCRALEAKAEGAWVLLVADVCCFHGLLRLPALTCSSDALVSACIIKDSHSIFHEINLLLLSTGGTQRKICVTESASEVEARGNSSQPDMLVLNLLSVLQTRRLFQVRPQYLRLIDYTHCLFW